MKEIYFITLMNQSGDCGEPYEVLNVSKDMMSNGKDEDVKNLIRGRIDDLFYNDIEGYFDSIKVTDEDVENCVNSLASGNDGNIAGEYFWWRDEGSAIVINH